MRCGRCGSEAMLGSAQCWSCGASLLDTGTDEPAADSPPPSPPPPAPAIVGHAPPPPPPPGWQPPPPGTKQPKARFRQLTTKVNEVKGGKALGCGCGLVVLASFVVPFWAVGAAIWDAVDDAVDDADDPSTSAEPTVVEAGTLRVGDEQRGELGDNELDRYVLHGVEGDVSITVRAVGDTDPIVTVWSQDGLQLGRNDDFAGCCDSRLTVRLEEGGRYRLDITEFHDDAGVYVVEVVRGGTSPEVPVSLPEEVAELFGGPLTRGVPVTAEVAEHGVVVYDYVGEGREVTIRVHGLDDFDPMVAVTTPSGAQLAENDDTDGYDAQVVLTVAIGEPVQVVVLGWADRGGRYTVEVT